MSLPPLLASILGWLREGYPNGVPEPDYVPLIALLRRRLSDDEVRAVTAALVDQESPVDRIDISVLITKVTDEMPLESDIARVSAHLALAGWPPADPAGWDHDTPPPPG